MNRERRSAQVDVVGVGLNATDTIIRLPCFPALDSKVEILSVDVTSGGQVASAMVACRRWGLRARYVGKIGDDDAGKIQIGEMKREGVESHWIIAKDCSSQSAVILVDASSGERTILWKRDPRLNLRPEELNRDWIRGARALLVDGHDTESAEQAARWAREEKITVVADLDNRYPGVEALLHHVDFAIASKEFPERLTGETDLLKSLPAICREFKCRLAAATLGRLGALAWDGARFHLCPGFQVKAIDTTGAGDVFHGAFLYGLLRSWTCGEILEFSCAAAAKNCEVTGARGGIATLDAIQTLREDGLRSERAYGEDQLRAFAREALQTAEAPR